MVNIDSPCYLRLYKLHSRVPGKCKKNHAKSRPNPVRRPFAYPGVSVMKDHTIFFTEKKKKKKSVLVLCSQKSPSIHLI